LASDLLHGGDGALANERDRHRVGAHAVARDAAGGVGGAEKGGTIATEVFMELFWSIIIAGVAIALGVFAAGMMVAGAIRGFAVVVYSALSTPTRYKPDYTELESRDEDTITGHLPPWRAPTALEVLAWQFNGIVEELFAIRDRIGGSPASSAEAK
jgi:hypothetical protein